MSISGSIRTMLISVMVMLCVVIILFSITCSDEDDDDNNDTDNTANLVFESGIIKIHPNTTYTGTTSLQLYAARNEYESFQIVVNGPMSDITIELGPLTGSGGTMSIDNMQYYRMGYMNVDTASNFEGATGLWPDSLIPNRDIFFNETRNGFPINVPAGENRAVWVDVFIPQTAQAGIYTGSVRIYSQGSLLQTLNYTLRVWNFELPSTSSFPTAFGFDGWEVLRGHYGSDGREDHYDQIVPLTQMYLDCGLMNRLTLSSPLHEDWDMYTFPVDWVTFDNRWSSYFDGRDLPFGLQQATVTSLEITDIDESNQERIDYWQDFAQHFKSQGWFSLLFDYTYDEPDDEASYQEIIDRATLVHQADPDLRVLVTTDIQEASYYGVDETIIDLWVPLINFIYGKPYDVCWSEEYEGNQRGEYNQLLASGAELWWYQSCMSHGCEGSDPDDQCESAYPSYMIDYSGVRNRIMSWMSYYYDIHGELYFAVNCADDLGDAWVSQFYFSGNGDGTLFYPGRPDMIGGTKNIPIESIRLKLIRDGLEDYEYFLLYEQLVGRDALLDLLSQMITNAYTYSEDPALMLSLRRQIGDYISNNSQ